jgi:hypothetical protein
MKRTVGILKYMIAVAFIFSATLILYVKFSSLKDAQNLRHLLDNKDSKNRLLSFCDEAFFSKTFTDQELLYEPFGEGRYGPKNYSFANLESLIGLKIISVTFCAESTQEPPIMPTCVIINCISGFALVIAVPGGLESSGLHYEKLDTRIAMFSKHRD